MAIKWAEIENTEKYKTATPELKTKIQDKYFDTFVKTAEGYNPGWEGKIKNTLFGNRTIWDNPILRSISAGLNTMNAGIARIPATAYDIAAIPQNIIAEKTGLDIAVKSPEWLLNNPAAVYYDKAAKSASYKQERWANKGEDLGALVKKGNVGEITSYLAHSVLENAPNQIALLGATVTGAGMPALIGMGAIQAAQTNVEGRKAGASPAASAYNALVSGTVESAFESIGTMGILKTWSTALAKSFGKDTTRQILKNVGKTVLYSVAGEGNEEFLTSLAQDFSSYATGVNPDALKGMTGRAFEAGAIGAISGGIMTAPTAIATGKASSKQAKFNNLVNDINIIQEEVNKTITPESKQEIAVKEIPGEPIIKEEIQKAQEKTYYHATTKENADLIRKEGIKQGMVTDTKSDAEEYAQMLRNRGNKNIEILELKIPISQLESKGIVETVSGKRIGERFNVLSVKKSGQENIIDVIPAGEGKVSQSLYHETNSQGLEYLMSYSDASGLNVSTDKNLALGQGGKGILVELNKDVLLGSRGSLTAIKKPGTDFVGQKEFRLVGGKNKPGTIKSITIKEGTPISKVQKAILNRDYNKVINEDRSITFTPKLPQPSGQKPLEEPPKTAIKKPKREPIVYVDAKYPESDVANLKQIYDEVAGGIAGHKRVNENKETGEVTAGYEPSDFPEYFKDKGLTKKNTLAILNKVFSGKQVTQKQKAIVDDLLQGYKELKDEEARLAAEGIDESEIAEADKIGREKILGLEGSGTVWGTRTFQTVEEASAFIDDIESKGGKGSITRSAHEAIEVTYERPETLTPSGEIKQELKPPQKKDLFQEEGELFKKKPQGPLAGGQASKGGRSIGTFEKTTGATAQTEFKLSEAVQKFSKKYAERIGETWNPRGTKGIFYSETKNIFLNALNDVSTVFHEIIHYIDNKNKTFEQIAKKIGTAKNGNPIYDSATLPARKALTAAYVKYYPGGKADHPLKKRVIEGFATFMQRMLEQPTITAQEFPGLVNDFLKPQGKYYNSIYNQALNDARKDIIEPYQALDDLSKIGAIVASNKNANNKAFLNLGDRIQQEIFDNLYPLTKLAKEAGKYMTLGDPSLWTRMYNNITQIVNNNLNTKNGYITLVGEEFKKIYDFNWASIIKDTGDKGITDKFNSWLVARRTHFDYLRLDELKVSATDAVEWLKTAREEGIVGQQEIKDAKEKVREYKELSSILAADGISREVATSAYNQYAEDFKDIADKFDKLTQADLDLMNNPAVGLLNPNKYAKLKEQEGYASFAREIYNDVLGEEEVLPRKYGPGGTKVSSLMGRTGSQRSIIPPMYSGVKNHAEITRKAMRQIVYNKIGELSSNFPGLFQKAPLEPSIDRQGRILYPQDKDPQIIMTRVDYKRVPIRTSTEIKKVIDELLTPQNIHIFEKVMTQIARIFTKGTTGIYIPFTISNIVVDQFTAIAQTKTNYVPIIDQLKLLRKAVANTSDSKVKEYFEEYMMLGGERHTRMNWMDMSPNEFFEAVIKEKNGLQKVTDLIEKGTNILAIPSSYSEIFTRLTEYIKARESGKPQIVALEMASQVSAPFAHIGRLGGGTFGRTTVKSIPFFNPALQVLGKYGQTLAEDPESRQRALFVLGALTVAMIGSLGLVSLIGSDEQKELYKNLYPSELASNIYFPHPIDKKKLLKFRIPEQMAVGGLLINMTIAQYLLNAKYTIRDFVDAGTAFVPDQINVTDPARMFLSWLPHIIRPTLEVLTNTKTYPKAMPLETQTEKRLEPRFRTRENTSLAAAWIGNKLNLSPVKLDHLIEGYLGRVTRFATLKFKGMNPLEREIYFSGYRKLGFYYDLKQKNDQEYASLKISKPTREEAIRVLDARDKLSPISDALKLYRELEKENKNDTRLNRLRTIILDGIDSL